MTDAPERICTWPSCEHTGRGQCGGIGIRADLPPTLEAALTVPEVVALVEALREIRDMRPHHAGQTRNECLMQQIAGDALRKVEGEWWARTATSSGATTRSTRGKGARRSARKPPDACSTGASGTNFLLPGSG